LAGAEGFEPPLAVLETAGLAVKPMPLHLPDYQIKPLAKQTTQPDDTACFAQFNSGSPAQKKRPTYILLCFAVRLMLAAERTEFLEFKAFCCRLLVLCITVIPTFALVALQLNDFACHTADSFLNGAIRAK
jgi:hypothetical protein